MGAAGTKHRIVAAGEHLGIACCAPADCQCMGGGDTSLEGPGGIYVAVEKPCSALRVLRATSLAPDAKPTLTSVLATPPGGTPQAHAAWPSSSPPSPWGKSVPPTCKAPRIPMAEPVPREQPARCFLPTETTEATEATEAEESSLPIIADENLDVGGVVDKPESVRSRRPAAHELDAPGARLAASDATARAAELAAEMAQPVEADSRQETEVGFRLEKGDRAAPGQTQEELLREDAESADFSIDGETEVDELQVSVSATGFQPWSPDLIRDVQENHQDAAGAFVHEILPLLLGECNQRDSSPSCSCSSWNEDVEVRGLCDNPELCGLGHLRGPLQKVAARPRPLELLLLSLAYVHLLRVCSGRSRGRLSACSGPSSSPRSLNSRHPCVEAFFLKYTCLKSRSELRTELEAWCPSSASASVVDTDGRWRWRPQSNGLAEGPDDLGITVDFDLLAAFVIAHAAPREVLGDMTEAWRSERLCAEKSNPAAGDLQASLELALEPLLGGSMGIADDGLGPGSEMAWAARNARHAARSAAMAALESDAKSVEELFARATSLARLLVMHLTGDVRRWRGFSCVRRRLQN